MEWRDEGLLLASRPHGESGAIIEVFTPRHGRHLGLVRGGAVSRRLLALLQPGAALDLVWRARLEDQLGHFTIEPLSGPSRAGILGDGLALKALNALVALLCFALPERDPHPALYAASNRLIAQMAAGQPGWMAAYLRWELALLDELGYGLDLSRCAITGSREDLAFVSPRSGRAVSRQAAGEWAARLLPLPACLLGQDQPSLADLVAGLRTSGHFLTHRLAPALGERPLPAARARLAEALALALARAAEGGGQTGG